MKVKIVTDSAADLPGEIIRSLGIEVVPIKVNYGRNTFRDGVDPAPEDFTDRIAGPGVYPTTSQPSPYEFQGIFQSLLNLGQAVLCITLSSELSGTYYSAAIAAEQVTGKVRVVDSQLVSAGLGLLVLRMAEFAKAEDDLDILFSLAEAEKKRIRAFAALDNIEPIVRGGRINLFTRHAADREGVKLVFTFNDGGRIQILERVRGRRRSLDRLPDLLAGQPISEAAIVHVDCIGEAQRIADMIQEQCGARIVYLAEAGSTVGTYAGRGAVIVAG